MALEAQAGCVSLFVTLTYPEGYWFFQTTNLNWNYQKAVILKNKKSDVLYHIYTKSGQSILVCLRFTGL